MGVFGLDLHVVNFLPYRNCAIFIGVLGTAQAIIWGGLSLFVLLYGAFGHVGRRGSNPYWYSFYKNYLHDRGFGHSRMLFFSITYFLLSLIWLFFSVHLLVKIYKSRAAPFPYISWSVVTLVICFVDIVVSILMVIDMVRMANERMRPSLKIQEKAEVLNVPNPYGSRLGVVLSIFTITSRGFFLWILNLVCAILLLMAQHDPKRPKKDQESNVNVYEISRETRKKERVSAPRPPKPVKGMEGPCSPCSPTMPCPQICPAASQPPSPPKFNLGMLQSWN